MFVKESWDIEVKNEEKQSKYSYRLTECRYKGEQAFGIEVEKIDIKNGKIVTIERDSVEVISNIESKVREILEILFKNIVSPIHFIDVAGEYIDDCIKDFDCKEIFELVYS